METNGNGSKPSRDYNALFAHIARAHVFGNYVFKVRDGEVYRIEYTEGFEDVDQACARAEQLVHYHRS